jgi:alanine dehydrogenase
VTPNPTLVSRAEQERLLDWAAVLPIVNESYVALARGEARLLPTLREPLTGGMLGFRGADWPARGLLGIKLSAFFLSNRELGLDSHQAVIVLLDPGTGAVRGIVDGNHVTWIRTALAGAAGTLALARSDARCVLIVGNGLQAEAQVRSHAWALADRSPEFTVHTPRDDAGGVKSAQFCRRLEARGIRVAPAVDLERALAAADVVVTATPSTEPVLRGGQVRRGTHVNAIGADAPGKRELDDVLLGRCLFVTDDREQCRRFGEGQRLDAERLERTPTIGEVLAGTAPGRTGDDAITVFDSTGLGLHDVATAAEACARAAASGAGTTLAL